MKIHHIGYLVDNIENAANEFERLGFSRMGKSVEDCSRQVNILFLDNASHVIELIQPVSKASSVYGLRKKYRNSPYHICYETNDIQNQIANMTNSDGGYIIIQSVQKAPAIPGCPDVAFLLNGDIGMIELVQSNKVNSNENY